MLEPKEQAKALYVESADIQVWLNNSGGYIALNWTNSDGIGKYDYVALFDHVPDNPDGYLTNQWQYITNQSSPYVTGTSAIGTEGPEYYIAYISWDYSAKEYKIVATNGPSQP